MTRNKAEQENLCLHTKYVIDKLRTNLFMIENFKDYDYFDKKLKRLKNDINDIYWNL